LAGSLVTVNVAAHHARELARDGKANPVPPKRCAVEASAWVILEDFRLLLPASSAICDISGARSLASGGSRGAMHGFKSKAITASLQ